MATPFSVVSTAGVRDHDPPFSQSQESCNSSAVLCPRLSRIVFFCRPLFLFPSIFPVFIRCSIYLLNTLCLSFYDLAHLPFSFDVLIMYSLLFLVCFGNRLKLLLQSFLLALSSSIMFSHIYKYGLFAALHNMFSYFQ